jgi:hypothetical protein
MKSTVIFMLAVLASCGRLYPQSNPELDSIFNYNFLVLDSVAKNMKKQSQLTPKQASFLYLIDGWVDSKTSFNHSDGIVFGIGNVQIWRSWYKKNSSKIDVDEFYKALNIEYTFFTKGVVPEADLEYLSELSKKYRAF